MHTHTYTCLSPHAATRNVSSALTLHIRPAHLSSRSTALVTLNLSSTLQNVVPIAVSNAFFLGEIISLTTTGGLPPDNPGKSLTGFVEAVTLTHVVLRDFRRKQTWITHANFTKYNIHNWTRRPCRLCHIQLTVSSRVEDAKKVAQLAAFSKKWMETNEKIGARQPRSPPHDLACMRPRSSRAPCRARALLAASDPSSYRKSVLVDVKNGLKLECIFYPLPGIDSYPIRQDYIVSIVGAAKRLGVPIVPDKMVMGFPDNQIGTPDAVEDMVLQDLLAGE